MNAAIYLKKGIRYACYFIIITAFMGMIYGVLGGNPLSPSIAAVTFFGVFVVLNFFVSIFLSVICIFLHIINRSQHWCLRYLLYSTSFLVVYGLYYAILKIIDIRVF